jgi:hypothetical protein
MRIPQKLLKKINQDYFNINVYADLMILLKSRYKFKLFDDKSKKKGIFLRHDIDVHPFFVRKFIKIYDKLKIKANFFFLLNSPNYNILSNEFKSLSKELIKKKHLIGMHICNDLKWDKKDIIAHQIYLKKKLNFSNVLSFHKPNKKNFTLKLNKMINVYNKKFFNYKEYVSDSNNNKQFLKKILNFISSEKKQFQILVHPIWWTSKKYRLKLELKKIFFNEYNTYINTVSKKLLIKS